MAHVVLQHAIFRTLYEMMSSGDKLDLMYATHSSTFLLIYGIFGFVFALFGFVVAITTPLIILEGSWPLIMLALTSCIWIISIHTYSIWPTKYSHLLVLLVTIGTITCALIMGIGQLYTALLCVSDPLACYIGWSLAPIAFTGILNLITAFICLLALLTAQRMLSIYLKWEHASIDTRKRI